MKLDELVSVSSAVAAAPGRLDKISKLAALFALLPPDDVPTAIGFLTGWPRQGRLGAGWATVASARDREPATESTLELREVDMAFEQLLSVRGKNSSAERARLLGDLFSRATADEQGFLAALMIGEVRQGALEGVMLEAIAKAAGVKPDSVRRAVMMAGDLGTVARALLTDGGAGLGQDQLEVFPPVQPMLADSAPTIADALGAGAPVVVEWKLDGARIQVHRRDDRVSVYTRNLNEVTDAVPEVVEVVRALPARELILDGEVIALAADGRPHPFQTTMRRFGRRLDVAQLRAELPLTALFFDILLHDGESLADNPLSERLERLDRIIPDSLRVPRLVTADLEEATQFQADALARGHEGGMVKSASAPYAAGRRGSAWIKVKEARTLDLVVLAEPRGAGRCKGWLSNIHLGARDPNTGGFVQFGKTIKGNTDKKLGGATP